MARIGLGITAAFAAATMAVSPAHASYIFDLTTPTSTLGGTSNGNSFTYIIGAGTTDQLQMRVTAWSIDTTKNPDLVQNAILRAYSGGLGVQNRTETNQSPDHAIDNSDGVIDFVMFQFDKAVEMTGMNIGWYSGDADATVRWGDTGTAWNISPALNGKGVTTLSDMIDGQVNSDVNSSTGFTGFRPLDIPLSNMVIISSRSPANTGTDYFKVISVTVDTGVPEPATWLMMIAGFGAIGTSMRRRRASNATNATANLSLA